MNPNRKLAVNIIRKIPRFRDAYNAQELLGQREGWSRGTIEEFQLSAVNNLWSHAIRNVPHFRKMYERMHLPSRFSSLVEFSNAVPASTKEEIRKNRFEFLSQEAKRGVWLYTGGSTGVPTPAYWDLEARKAALHVQYRARLIWGIDIFDEAAYLWGHSASFAPGFRGQLAKLRLPLEDYMRNRIRLSAYALDVKNLDNYIERIQDFKPRILYSYSSAAMLLARRAEQRGVRPASLKLAVLTAEPAYQSLVESVERAFRIPAVKEYGAVETGVMAYEIPSRSLVVREDRIFLEASKTDSNTYKILVTVLDNLSYPLIRYEIGDLTDRPLQSPPKGFSTLGDIIGRSNDFLIGKDGVVVHPEALTHVVKQFASSIVRFTAHQHADGRVTLRLEADSMTNSQVNHMKNALTKLLSGQHIDVDFSGVEPTVAGKHRWIISDINKSK